MGHRNVSSKQLTILIKRTRKLVEKNFLEHF